MNNNDEKYFYFPLRAPPPLFLFRCIRNTEDLKFLCDTLKHINFNAEWILIREFAPKDVLNYLCPHAKM